MGIQALRSHQKGKKHVSAVNSFSCFFKATSSNTCQSSTPINEESTSKIKDCPSSSKQNKKQQTLELNITTSEKVFAEIMWALHCCMNGISNNSNKDTNKLFQTMFPDSNIAKSFEMGTSKHGYVITHGLGPYFKDLLKNELNQSTWLVVSFDESLNKKTQTCQMDFLIRYWNEVKSQVEVRYWDSSFIGHSTAKDLLNHFTEKICDLNLTKVVQVSMDGPSVNMKFHRDLQNYREQYELPKVIDIGSCGLHIIHGEFKTGAESIDWEVKKTFKGCFVLLHDSPARRNDYTSITGSSTFRLYFCSTRWVEDKSVAEILITIWPSIVQIVNYWEKLPKSKRPSCKSYEYVVKAVKNELSLSKFQFFSYVASLFEPYLKLYQTDAPMVPYMKGDLMRLVKSILRLFIKSDAITACSDLTKIDLRKEENRLKYNQIDIGFSADGSLSKCRRQDKVTPAEIKIFKKECIQFLISTVEKLFERCPLGSVVIRMSSCLAPNLLAQSTHEASIRQMKILLRHLISLNILTSSASDKVISQFSNFMSKEVTMSREIFVGFDRSDKRLDDFYFKDISIAKYPDLAAVIKLLLTLSHGQASVERGFSVNKAVIADNISMDGIVGRRHVKDHLLANNLRPHTVPITSNMKVAFKSSRQKYQLWLDDEKSKKEKQLVTVQKAIIMSEIDGVRSQVSLLKKTSVMLDTEFVWCVERAEKENDVSLVSKANALKRKSEEKKREVVELEETLAVLEEKRRKLK